MPTFYALHVSKKDLTGTLRLNDVPLSHWSDLKPAAAAHAVNMWITGRSNSVSVLLEWPEGKAALQPDFEAKIMVTTRSDQPSAQGTAIATFHWPADPLSPERTPEIAFTFEASDPPPSALWPAATPIYLDATARAGVVSAVMELHNALARRDLERAAAILDFKTADIGRAMYMDPGGARTSQRDFLDFFLSQPGWAMERLDATAIDLQLVAGRRLVLALGSGGTAALKSVASRSPQLELPVYLARIDGRWTVVR